MRKLEPYCPTTTPPKISKGGCSSSPAQVLRGVRILSLVLFDGPRVLVSTGEIRGAYPHPLSVISDRCEYPTDESDTDVGKQTSQSKVFNNYKEQQL
jgi:hypothetical protein